MLALLENSRAKVISQRGIPTEDDVKAALQTCKVVADYIMDESVQPQISHMISEMDSTASNLLSLDSSARAPAKKTSGVASNPTISAQLKQLTDKISTAAYATLKHPNVHITPSLLAQYVDVQARLGRPETLPAIFELYASKPLPRAAAAGAVAYNKPWPNMPANAIKSEVIEEALDTAIEAKNLDAAIGIVETSYSTKAFIRAKILRFGTIPGLTMLATPFAAHVLATQLANMQSSLDVPTATNIAFWGMLAYVGFTASMGLVATATANDQMRRVTWAPGIALRKRWAREEERAALDKIVCAWGYKEAWRQGEEEGADWDVLKEFIGQRGMIVDRTELLEGMDQ
jgi:hypothetical protein